MVRLVLVAGLDSGVTDVLRGASIAVVTLVILVTVLVLYGFGILFRRRGDRGVRGADAGLGKLRARAGSLLVRTDDALRESEDELGFAIAQFGEGNTRGYAAAIAGAKKDVAEAFRLKHSLDDSYQDTARQEREWTLQIIALCERAQDAMTEQGRAFEDLRRREVNAASTLAELREQIAQATARLQPAKAKLDSLGERYPAATLAGVADNVPEAERLLGTAASATDAAARGISAAGVSSVSSSLQEAGQAAHRATQLLDAIDKIEGHLTEAGAALERLVAETRTDLEEARVERERAPDAATGQAIIAAISRVEAVLLEVTPRSGRSDPVGGLDLLGDAVAGLDTALASARNQQQRLEHARSALTGTLVSARSQIAVARDAIASGGGLDARTRLAEAERQLMLAEVEADPVEALDTARRAVAHARDADALARFATLGRRR